MQDSGSPWRRKKSGLLASSDSACGEPTSCRRRQFRLAHPSLSMHEATGVPPLPRGNEWAALTIGPLRSPMAMRQRPAARWRFLSRSARGPLPRRCGANCAREVFDPSPGGRGPDERRFSRLPRTNEDDDRELRSSPTSSLITCLGTPRARIFFHRANAMNMKISSNCRSLGSISRHRWSPERWSDPATEWPRCPCRD